MAFLLCVFGFRSAFHNRTSSIRDFDLREDYDDDPTFFSLPLRAMSASHTWRLLCVCV